MIKINLLAAESIKKEERKELFILAVAIVAAIVVIGAVRYGVKAASYARVEARVSSTQKELSTYESIVRQVEALQATKNILETKKNLISTLMAGRLLYPQFMEELIGLMPANIWFESLTTTLAGDKLKVTLNARALDNYAIADFITALSAAPDFSNVEMGPLSTSTTQKSEMSAFKLDFEWQKKKP